MESRTQRRCIRRGLAGPPTRRYRNDAFVATPRALVDGIARARAAVVTRVARISVPALATATGAATAVAPRRPGATKMSVVAGAVLAAGAVKVAIAAAGARSPGTRSGGASTAADAARHVAIVPSTKYTCVVALTSGAVVFLFIRRSVRPPPPTSARPRPRACDSVSARPMRTVATHGRVLGGG